MGPTLLGFLSFGSGSRLLSLLQDAGKETEAYAGSARPLADSLFVLYGNYAVGAPTAPSPSICLYVYPPQPEDGWRPDEDGSSEAKASGINSIGVS